MGKRIKKRELVFVVVLLILIGGGVFYLIFSNLKSDFSVKSCDEYSLNDCPNSCLVCPPCEACSSLKCQTKDTCKKLGFNEDWLNQKKECIVRSEICPEYYNAVCGWFSEEIKCIKYPCAKDYSNECFACADKNVKYWTSGECPK